jgi:hypothetical protein
MTILETLQEFLKERELSFTLAKATDEIPYERLMVALSTSENADEDLLEITIHPQFFEGSFTDEPSSESYHLVQFRFVLPIGIPPTTFNQVASALHFFNRLLHCPGFELDELEDQIFYRHVWFVKQKGIDSFLLMQVIGNLHLCYKMFSPYIKEIAEGKSTLEDILQQVLEAGKQLKK